MMSIILLLGLACTALAAPSVDSALMQSLAVKETTTIIISFKGSNVSEVRHRASSVSYADRTARINGLVAALKSHADETQANVLNILERAQKKSSTQIAVRQLWVSNQIVVRGANDEIVKELAAAAPEISSIKEDEIIPLEAPIEKIIHPEGYSPKVGEQWGVSLIEAPAVWEAGNTGQGVVVGSIDSGVRGTHEALRENYRSENGWFDPESGTLTPNDNSGHGTHTMGTIAGRVNGTGVAPGVQWIACVGCNGGCPISSLTECGQWMLCPTDAEGNNPNCSLAPQLVSNSWGGVGGRDHFDDVLLAWQAAGIVPIFSIGNSGPDCGTAGSPGDSLFVIGVGSTTSADELSSFSSVGPTIRGRRIKPEVSAPGSSVISAWYTSDTAYATLSGTSMACPHVAGLSALLLAENADLTFEELKVALAAGGQPIQSTGRNCGGIDESVYPNHHSGAGRINAVASLASVKALRFRK